MPKRIFIVDDQKIVLDSLDLLISLIDDVEVVGTSSDSTKVLEEIENKQIDVLITDFQMPSMDGIQLTSKVKALYPQMKVLLLSVNDESDNIIMAYNAGCDGYILKRANRTEIEKALTTVSKGQLYYSPESMKAIVKAEQERGGFDGHVIDEIQQLTPREKEVVSLIAQELSTNEIAEKLHIGVGTVESHRHKIMRKLRVKNVVGIAKFALKSGLVEL